MNLEIKIIINGEKRKMKLYEKFTFILVQALHTLMDYFIHLIHLREAISSYLYCAILAC